MCILKDVKDKKLVNIVLALVANLYRGNAPYSSHNVEYKTTCGSFKKIEKIIKAFHVDSRKCLNGYSLTEFIEPLLYNDYS